MATAFSTLIARARRRYAQDSAVDDAVLSSALLIDRVNELLQEAGSECEAFREEFSLNLSGTVANHTLSVRVLRIIENTVRIDHNGDGEYELRPTRWDEAELLALFGPIELEPAGVPDGYFVRRSATADAMAELVLFPRSSVARTNGIKFYAQVVPPVIAATTDTLPLQTAEERFLLPGLCQALAEVELAGGRADAPVAYWTARWERAKDEWRAEVRRLLSPDQRRIHHVDAYW